jgi:hypothetical protein
VREHAPQPRAQSLRERLSSWVDAHSVENAAQPPSVEHSARKPAFAEVMHHARSWTVHKSETISMPDKGLLRNAKQGKGVKTHLACRQLNKGCRVVSLSRAGAGRQKSSGEKGYRPDWGMATILFEMGHPTTKAQSAKDFRQAALA